MHCSGVTMGGAWMTHASITHFPSFPGVGWHVPPYIALVPPRGPCMTFPKSLLLHVPPLSNPHSPLLIECPLPKADYPLM